MEEADDSPLRGEQGGWWNLVPFLAGPRGYFERPKLEPSEEIAYGCVQYRKAQWRDRDSGSGNGCLSLHIQPVTSFRGVWTHLYSFCCWAASLSFPNDPIVRRPADWDYQFTTRPANRSATSSITTTSLFYTLSSSYYLITHKA